MRPPPSRVAGTSVVPVTRTGSPVDSSADLISSTVHVGWRCMRTAAAPATCGDAMLVPLHADQLAAGIEERTFTPGAVTSGFISRETGVGPLEEKSAIRS